jgi:hypothetical protein
MKIWRMWGEGRRPGSGAGAGRPALAGVKMPRGRAARTAPRSVHLATPAPLRPRATPSPTQSHPKTAPKPIHKTPHRPPHRGRVLHLVGRPT